MEAAPYEQQLYGQLPAKAGRPARTYIQQLCADTGCSLEDLPGVMDDRGVAGESQGDPCRRHMMMIYILV